MKVTKGSEPNNQATSSEKQQLSDKDFKAITDLFGLLLEMHIDQNDVTKERSSEKPHNRCSNYSRQT